MGILDAPVYPIPKVARPSGMPAFTKLPTPKIYRLGGGRFRGVLDLSTLKPSGGTTC